MSSAKLGGRADPCSTQLAQEQLAQEQAAEKRAWGRPSAGWAGPRQNMKMDDQPENNKY